MDPSKVTGDISGCNTEEYNGHPYTGYCSYFVQTSGFCRVVRGAPSSTYTGE